MATKRPHIVLFNPDQWRSDTLGHMGNPAVVTPVLDEWVESDAVSFRHAFCQNTVCTPSRCSFMTGWYPHVRGHRTMYHMLRPDEPMLLRMLKESGYYVWWGGKNDVVASQAGFDAYCDVKYRPARPPKAMWMNDRQAEWRGEPGDDTYYSFYVGELDPGGEDIYYDSDWANVQGAIDLIKNPPTDKPLCIYLPLTYPHPPYGVEEPWFSITDRERIPPRIAVSATEAGKPSILRGVAERQELGGWTEDRWTALRATYYGMCSRVDFQFGLLLNALREAGIYDDTAVFLFSDHGDYTGDYGIVEKTENTFEDCVSRVPLLVKPPKGTPVRPGVRNALVELIDVSATVEAITGVEPRHTHFGRSLLPLIAGETETHRAAVFSEGGRLDGEMQAMGLASTSSGDPKGLYWPRVELQKRIPEHTKAAMCRTQEYKYVRRMYESDELYDLRADPHETQNRIDDPALVAVRAELSERMLAWYMETCDAVPFALDER